jgi:hypothetical protein
VQSFICNQSYGSGMGDNGDSDNESVEHTADFFLAFPLRTDKPMLLGLARTLAP